MHHNHLRSTGLLCLGACTLPLFAGTPPLPPANTGIFYVSDFNDDEIAVYDRDGAYLRSFDAFGLNGPRGIVVTPDGPMYVASQLTNTVYVFDADEQHVDTLVSAALNNPTGLMRRNDELYVCSFNNDQVVVFELDTGAVARTFTGGGLNGPNCAAMDSAGNIYVSSALTARVIKFDAAEQFVTSFTGGGLSSPMGIAIDANDVLYVAGGSSSDIVRFDTSGNYLDEMTHPDLTGQQGVAFDDCGHLFSSSYFQDQIVEFDANGQYVQTISVGNLNIPRSIAFKPMRVGDLDDDGVVNFGDLLDVISAWGPCGDCCDADLDGDESVGFSDILVLITNWG